MTAFVGAPMFFALLLPILSPGRQQSFLFGSTNLPVPVLCLLVWGALPMFFAATNGGGMAKLDIWGKVAMPAFFATRPLTTPQFVLIKFLACAIGVVASWTITLGLFAIWALIESSSLNSNNSLIRGAFSGATPRGILAAVIVVFAIVALTWRNVVSGLWPTLLGRKHFANTIGFAFLGLFVLVGCVGTWVFKHPAYHETFWRILPWLVGAELILKIAVMIWLSDMFRRRGFISFTAMKSLVAGWLLLVAGCVGLLCLFMTPTWMSVAVTALMVPFASLAAAPLALDWNRHR